MKKLSPLVILLSVHIFVAAQHAFIIGDSASQIKYANSSDTTAQLVIRAHYLCLDVADSSEATIQFNVYADSTHYVQKQAVYSVDQYVLNNFSLNSLVWPNPRPWPPTTTTASAFFIVSLNNAGYRVLGFLP